MKLYAIWTVPAALGLLQCPVVAQNTPVDLEPTTEADVREHIAILASDDFAGRDPGTIGEIKTLTYLSQQWATAGMVSGTNDADKPWFQPVPLVQSKPVSSSVRILQDGKSLKLNENDILIIGTAPDAAVEGPIVFVGYGTDGEGKVLGDVAGKITLMLYATPEGTEKYPSRDERRAALADAGAAAVLTVVPDSFPWRAVKRSIKRGSYERASDDRQPMITGAVRYDFAEDLLRLGDSSLKAESEAAQNAVVYVGYDTGLTADLSATTAIRRFTSHNVIGKFPGNRPGSGAVMLMGHWDHFGSECRPPEAEDRICNGAVDNASGMAVLTEVAEELGRLGPFDRDIYFMGTTAEERGLLGAYHYADYPAFPLDDIVAAFNLDTTAIAPRGTPVATIGRGETDLDDEIDAISRSLGREVDESLDANEFIKRQDGWAFAAKGVPAFMIGGSFADDALLQKFLRGNYHSPDDETENILDLGGAAEDADLHIALVRYFADTEKYSKE
ncbi:M28 family peptidase [Alterisphingorhabdus coralli]|uniref:M28 family peptidase n=1 Tax=Alterisphingorhabdus coralli TaxID=3071408 RepID=A0AA97HYS0_9SPHN|nr:M28 family peptidase [Parasphingorhabdus sp. SCSIO 66989]WOE73804.1 M28 family peptidase [Parasphingorhabdus sp. SCSIO 66989]